MLDSSACLHLPRVCKDAYFDVLNLVGYFPVQAVQSTMDMFQGVKRQLFCVKKRGVTEINLLELIVILKCVLSIYVVMICVLFGK